MKKYLITLFLFLIILASAAGGYFLYKNKFAEVSSNKRQAVFLTNGQVYFGKIEYINNRFLVLKDIYYLKTQDDLSSTSTENQSSEDKKKISVIKLGEELHGPEDKIYVSREQVLFYENMKDDSKINSAIQTYQDKQKTGQQ